MKLKITLGLLLGFLIFPLISNATSPVILPSIQSVYENDRNYDDRYDDGSVEIAWTAKNTQERTEIRLNVQCDSEKSRVKFGSEHISCENGLVYSWKGGEFGSARVTPVRETNVSQTAVFTVSIWELGKKVSSRQLFVEFKPASKANQEFTKSEDVRFMIQKLNFQIYELQARLKAQKEQETYQSQAKIVNFGQREKTDKAFKEIIWQIKDLNFPYDRPSLSLLCGPNESISFVTSNNETLDCTVYNDHLELTAEEGSVFIKSLHPSPVTVQFMLRIFSSSGGQQDYRAITVSFPAYKGDSDDRNESDVTSGEISDIEDLIAKLRAAIAAQNQPVSLVGGYFKVNGSEENSSVRSRSTFTAKWNVPGAAYCRPYGSPVVIVDDGGLWTEQYVLSTSGSFKLRAASREISTVQNLILQCFSGDPNNTYDLPSREVFRRTIELKVTR